MPLFEQKLISPLAVRFTQEHIRTTFRDGRPVEESCEQITTKPGIGDYDLLLEVPFPNIEIIRWRVPRSGKEPRDKEHWFTLDNRRLYCMQRAAMKHWPKRVGAVVDLLYADPGTATSKFDSSSRGHAVRIGRGTLSKWDWIWEMPKTCEGEDEALQAIDDDDKRQHASELRDAQEQPSSLLDLALAGAFDPPAPAEPEAGEVEGEAKPGLATPSTANSSDESKSEEGKAGETRPRRPRVARWAVGNSTSLAAETEEPRPRGPRVARWAVANSSPLAVETEESQPRGPRAARWAVTDGSTLTNEPEELAPETEVQPEKAAGGAAWDRSADAEYQDAANEAAAEVERQLRSQGNKGFVWVTSWNEWYLPLLGTLRSFIENQPDRFIVHPGRGRAYTVSLVDADEKEEGQKTAEVPSRGPGASTSAEGSRRENRQTAASAPNGHRRPGRGGGVQKKWVVAGGGA